MSVLVQFTVKVSDVDRFMATARKFEPLMEAMGARAQRVYSDENEPDVIAMMAEWDSHDQMMAGTDKYGDAFNSEAGTEGIEWETRIWHEI